MHLLTTKMLNILRSDGIINLFRSFICYEMIYNLHSRFQLIAIVEIIHTINLVILLALQYTLKVGIGFDEEK